jgi:flagellar biosynthesis protein FlhB
MTERRPFPPSPRRLALARQAGLTAASPLVGGAVATIAALVAAVFLARAAGALVGGWIAAACGAADGGAATSSRGVLSIGDLAPRVLELAAPIVGVAAIAAFVAHVAQTRGLWLPRRRIPGAPSVEPARVQRTAFDIAAATVVGVVAFAWLWTTAPRLASLFVAGEPVAAAASALASFLAALAIAWLALAVLDVLVRRVQLARALAMTVTEKREDDRLTAADPRWRAQRAALTRGPSPRAAVAQSALVLLGDDIAVAIAWDPRRQPVPLRLASGRRAHATQLVGLARRYRVAVHRDAQLVTALEGEGPVPDTYWPRLAEIIAAVQAANTGRDLPR